MKKALEDEGHKLEPVKKVKIMINQRLNVTDLR